MLEIDERELGARDPRRYRFDDVDPYAAQVRRRTRQRSLQSIYQGAESDGNPQLAQVMQLQMKPGDHMNKIALIAAAAGALAAVPAQASPVITSIQVTNADGIAGQGYLQIAELQLFGGATNYALSGTASATSTYVNGSAVPSYAKDGNLRGDYPYIYHGNDANGGDVFTLTLAAPTAVDRISIYGRTDACCGFRDLYKFTTFDGTTAVQSGTLDAREGGFATVAAVPEPATWAMMMLGFGMIGFGLRRRSKVTTSVRFA